MSAHVGCISGPAKLLRHGITLVGVLKVVTVSQELRRSGFAPKMSRHSAVGSISDSPPQADETEITGDHTEINGDSQDHTEIYFCLDGRVLMIQEISTLPGIAVNGSNDAKQCRAVHTCSNSQISRSAHPPHTACSQTYLRAIRELQDGKAKYPRPNFHPRLRF